MSVAAAMVSVMVISAMLIGTMVNVITLPGRSAGFKLCQHVLYMRVCRRLMPLLQNMLEGRRAVHISYFILHQGIVGVYDFAEAFGGKVKVLHRLIDVLVSH